MIISTCKLHADIVCLIRGIMLKKIFFYIFCFSIILSVTMCLSYADLSNISTYWKLIIFISIIVLFGLTILFKYFKLNIISKIMLTSFVLLSIVVIAYTIMYKSNLLYIFSSVSSLKNYIISTKEKGVIIYIILQLLQVIFLPIPASIICIVGSLIYGPILGGLYCCVGVLIGSFISFIIGRVFGYRLVSWIVGKDNTDKYSDIIRKRGGFFLALAFLLPMFPDDILCFIAGTTKMNFKTFSWITIITRPIGVICMAIFGSGYVIPFSGWGVYAWIVILIIAVILVWVVYRWQDSIQEYILNKIFKKRRSNLINHRKSVSQ